jgi:hypothetical protein
MPKITRLCDEAKAVWYVLYLTYGRGLTERCLCPVNSKGTGGKATTKTSKSSSAPKKASAAPPKPKGSKMKSRSKKKKDGDEEGTESDDRDYIPAKRGRGVVSSDSDDIGQVYGSQGEEVTEESERLKVLVRGLVQSPQRAHNNHIVYYCPTRTNESEPRRGLASPEKTKIRTPDSRVTMLRPHPSQRRRKTRERRR